MFCLSFCLFFIYFSFAFFEKININTLDINCTSRPPGLLKSLYLIVTSVSSSVATTTISWSAFGSKAENNKQL